MATAEELFLASGIDEQHIIINSDRSITVPTELKNVAVQNDHNIETVVFDCPRYWDGCDMSTMKVSINYVLSNGYEDTYVCPEVTIDETDQDIMHFSWTISNKVTQVSGEVTFLVCLMLLDSDGIAIKKWHSQISKDMRVLDGMDCDTIATNEYEEGKKAAWSNFWDAYQANGTLTDYRWAFHGDRWTESIFKPKYSIYPILASNMFSASSLNIDLSSWCSELNISIDFSRCRDTTYLFYGASFVRLPEINLTSTDNISVREFGEMRNLVTIDKLVLKSDGSQQFANNFTNDYKLENIIIEGTIGQNGFNVQWCPLTHDSLMSIINALQDKTGVSGSWTVTIGTDNRNKLTSDELAIAENKNWSVV